MHATTDADEIEIELLYVRGAHTRDADALATDSPLFELTRDLHCFAEETFDQRDLSPATALFAAYDSIGTATYLPDEFDTTDALLEHIYRTCQGTARASGLPYDGSYHRSLSMGDVIAVDGTPFMVARIGFEKLDVDLRGGA